MEYKPFVPPDKQLKEFTFKAVFLGIVLAVILGAANAYLGLKAGMTVAATFPAAVISMAVLRMFKGTILEENISRTTGAVGEALAAGAIFTVPAFVMSGVWEDFHYLEATAVVLIGGVLGVLFVILLRKAMVEDTSLKFPESVATYEIVVAGQGGQTGAKYVFFSMLLSGVIEFFNNSNGIKLIKTYIKKIWIFGESTVRYLDPETSKELVQHKYHGAFFLETPRVSPALIGVGYIIGPKLAALTFAGGVFGWLFLMPIVLFLNKDSGVNIFSLHSIGDQITMAKSIYNAQIKPIAVGAMIIGAFYTLYKMRKNLWAGIANAFKGKKIETGSSSADLRTNKDLSIKGVIAAIILLLVPLFVIYYHFTSKLPNSSLAFGSSLILTVVMAALGFLFAAVAGYLVGIIGSSSNPISGLTLSTLLIAAVIMVALGATGSPGIAAVLGVATVVCAIAGVAGDMIQDWKVGHMLGGTPWKMQIGGMMGVISAGLVLVLIISLLHTSNHIGSDALPAPQAGLMSMMSKGIINGEMAWLLVIAGMFFAFALILIGSLSPMLIAVGMYLPFSSTFAIFVGGIIAWIVQWMMKKKKVSEEAGKTVENTGILLASGLIAGEALMGVILAGIYAAGVKLPKIGESIIVGVLMFIVLGFVLVYYPLKAANNSKNE